MLWVGLKKRQKDKKKKNQDKGDMNKCNVGSGLDPVLGNDISRTISEI